MGKKIHGIALVPGVSRNNRLYTRDMVARAHDRLAARIAEGSDPVVMRTHHGAGDDSTRVVGVLESVSLTKDGALQYQTRMADTQTANDIAALAESQDNKAAVKVSVYGKWIGRPRMVQHDGRFVETADDIDIDKIDFTATPGFTGTSAIVSEAISDDPSIIAESVRPVMFTDETAEAVKDTDTVMVNVCGSSGGIDVSIGAWCIPATELDAYTDTIQRALAAALDIASGGPVDDDGDAAGETIDDDAMETKTPGEHPVVETKEANMATEEKPATAGTEAVAESAADEKAITPADVAAIVAEALKQAGVVPVAETKVDEKPIEETKTEEQQPTVDLTAFKASIAESVVAELVKSGSVKPQRKGYRLAETTEPTSSWDNRGEEFAKALGLIDDDGNVAAAGD